MKILDLYLSAFGPFTDRHLDLSGGQHGLHIIFGANEAGKSSALRALRSLLFGIPKFTSDNFQHAYQQLRVGGRLRAADGTEVELFRRKGQKHTLRDANDAVLADDTLTRLLGGVDERLFERQFGIDHDSLISGGQAVLAERGREAETLFGAGLGGGNVHAVLKRLDQEATELFSPRASTRLINAQLSQFAELERQQRQLVLLGSAWEEARATVQELRQQLAAVETELLAATRQRSRLERIRRTLPNLARHAQLLAQLAELHDVPPLSADFGSRREAAWKQRTLALASQANAQARATALRQQETALVIQADLLAEAAVIDGLLTQLGSHNKAAIDRVRLETDRLTCNHQAAALLAHTHPTVPLAAAGQLQPLLQHRHQVTTLGGQGEVLAAALAQTRAQQTQTTALRQRTEAALAALPQHIACDALRHAIAEARRAGDLERTLTQAQAQQQRHDEDCQRQLAALTGWTADLTALCCAPLPTVATVERFIKQFQELDNAQQRTGSAQTEERAEQQRMMESVRALQLLGAVPTEAELELARQQRDALWLRLKTGWLAGTARHASASATSPPLEFSLREPAAPAPKSDTKTERFALAEQVDAALAAVDQLADRLRREVKRVHEQATATARLEFCAQRLEELALVAAAQQERREHLTQEWRAMWADCAVQPLPPREMLQWLTQANRLREVVKQAEDWRAQLAELQTTCQRHIAAVTAALTTIGTAAVPAPARWGALLLHAEAQVAALLETQRQRMLLTQEFTRVDDSAQRLATEVAQREADWQQWSQAWATLMSTLGLPPTASAATASAHLNTLNDCLALLHEAERLAGRIAGIDHDAQTFRDHASAVLRRLAPDLLALTLEDGVAQLHQRLGQQREERSRLQEVQRQLGAALVESEQATAQLHAAEAVLTALCREAHCDDAEALVLAEQREQQRRDCQQRCLEVEAALISAGDGLDVAALRAEAGAVDYDAVAAEVLALETQIDGDLHPRQLQLFEKRVHAERVFAEMAGDPAAAALAEQSQAVLATVRGLAERYVRVKLAARILRDAIEAFRRAHRDPLVACASSYFAQLTCGAFGGIETDFDSADDQHILIGRRANGERVPVEGMSTGTRDQLYLALRLATLEQQHADGEPLPLIVDDILIQFDDARAQATLAALANFAATTQVILFTHHQQVVTLARALDPSGERVLVQSL
ncbi:chromosome segregation protein SMC [Chromatium okenii]|uniref:ATP-binding protein n=1 Tax=Chromatium okenii TaxID=61644 RepID=UPI0019031F04|nr:YhaN family protein [Chromatium okenii]MBK1640689.1 chromosome segregation protein SMC [Chromatium okenii]